MLFNLEEDHGDRLLLYLVPDGFARVPGVRVVSGGEEIYSCDANERRDALVGAGRHETGQCGFNIGPEQIPGLAGITDVSVHDRESGVLIYRRRRPEHVARKVLRLETHLFPLWNFDNALAGRFQYFERGVDHFGRETTTQMFLLNKVDSVWLSGRIQYKNFAYYIDQGFEPTIILQDPYEEFAERLLVLAMLGDDSHTYLGERDATRLVSTIDFAKSVPVDADVRQLRRVLERMPDEVELMLAEPLVRMLTTSTPDEMPGRAGVASALDVLSTCQIIGLRGNFDEYRTALAAWLEIPEDVLPLAPRFQRVQEFAAKIRESRRVDHLVERDCEVFDHFMTAYRKSLED